MESLIAYSYTEAITKIRVYPNSKILCWKGAESKRIDSLEDALEFYYPEGRPRSRSSESVSISQPIEIEVDADAPELDAD